MSLEFSDCPRPPLSRAFFWGDALMGGDNTLLREEWREAC